MKYGIFDENIFDSNIFDTEDIPEYNPKAVQLNAYKAFKTLREFRGEPRIGYPRPSTGTSKI